MSKQDQPIQVAGFEILTKLSSGGMGDVLLARRRAVGGFEKLLAVKTIRGDLARRNDIRAMFLDEARLVAQLDHPAIAHVYDFGEHEGSLYLAMEYVHGIALNKLLVKRQKELPPSVAIKIAAEVARGLHAAHQLTDKDGTPLGVVHRDVSPGNVILTFDAHVKILDFGIAFMNARESPDTQLGELKGKPSYMSPEQLRCERVDRRSDIYSLSVVLHEMLTGRKLFSRQNVVATALAVERGEAPSVRAINPSVPAQIDEIVMRGLATQSELRFNDARQLAQALDEVLASMAGPTLEDFIESEISEDVKIHKGWLHGVLEGPAETDRSFDSWRPPTKEGVKAGVTAPGRPETGGKRAPTPPKESRALAESVTLVPPSATERAPAAKGRGVSPALASSAIFVAALSLFVGYRLLSPGGESETAIAPIAPIPAETASAPPSEVDTPDPAPAEAEEDPAPIEEESADAPNADNNRDPEPKERSHKRARRPVREPRPEAPPGGDLSGALGFVTIGAEPYALVRIDGQQVGTTPIMRHKLAVGRHKIELLRPDTGEIRHTQTVELKEGQHERITLQ